MNSMEDGVEIYNRFYPWPSQFRLGDPVLVREVTGMSWPEFVAALDTFEDEDTPDQVVLAGLIAVAFWQGNPQMTREKARRAIEKTPQDMIEVVEGDEENPPPPGAVGNAPTTTTNGSDVSQAEAASTEIPAASI